MKRFDDLGSRTFMVVVGSRCCRLGVRVSRNLIPGEGDEIMLECKSGSVAMVADGWNSCNSL